MQNELIKIAVIGLGYVGLPVAIEFSKKYDVIGYDLNKDKIKELLSGIDVSGEVCLNDINCIFTNNIFDLIKCNVFIVCVPTPVDDCKVPDLSFLLDASENIGKILKKGDLVVYESTVYPGATEECCIPVLEKNSDLVLNRDFSVGYSPERINPGDKINTISKIVKVTSASNKKAADFVDNLYSSIIAAGTFKAKSIKVAEAAKIIENTQRDINIALINELTTLFSKLDISIYDVLEAANTKWNFLQFTPGLVGGHCVGVDPYYLTHKANQVNHNPELIIAGRRINEEFPSWIASKFIKKIISTGANLTKCHILVMGISFKENCSDVRNTKVINLIDELSDYGIKIDIYDPHVSKSQVKEYYDLELIDKPQNKKYSAIILAVAHSDFITINTASMLTLLNHDNGFVLDLKNCLKNHPNIEKI